MPSRPSVPSSIILRLGIVKHTINTSLGNDSCSLLALYEFSHLPPPPLAPFPHHITYPCILLLTDTHKHTHTLFVGKSVYIFNNSVSGCVPCDMCRACQICLQCDSISGVCVCDVVGERSFVWPTTVSHGQTRAE